MKPDLYSYTNYRLYLEDFYLSRKKEHSHFSYQYIAEKAGFKSKSFLRDIISGRKNLSSPSLFKLNQVLELSNTEFDFFSNLVFWEQAETEKEKDYYLDKVLHTTVNSKLKRIVSDQYEFYSCWHHNIIRELVCEYPFQDFTTLAKQIEPNISTQEAKDSVSLLLRLELIQNTENGYALSDKIISTGPYVQSQAVQEFHNQSLQKAVEKLASVPGAAKDFSSIICSLTPEGYKAAQKEIQKFRRRLLHIANEEQNPNRVYQFNVQLYPTSRIIR